MTKKKREEKKSLKVDQNIRCFFFFFLNTAMNGISSQNISSLNHVQSTHTFTHTPQILFTPRISTQHCICLRKRMRPASTQKSETSWISRKSKCNPGVKVQCTYKPKFTSTNNTPNLRSDGGHKIQKERKKKEW